MNVGGFGVEVTLLQSSEGVPGAVMPLGHRGHLPQGVFAGHQGVVDTDAPTSVTAESRSIGDFTVESRDFDQAVQEMSRGPR